MADLATRAKWRWLRTLKIWDSTPIRAQGGVLALIPLAAVLVSFGFAIYGNVKRTNIQEDIELRFASVRYYGGLLTLMIDAETGERGYILTHRPEYLEPYQKAVNEIPAKLEQISNAVNSEPGEKPRNERLESIAEIQQLIAKQLGHLKASQSYGADKIGSEELNAHLQAGKQTMDQIREKVSSMQVVEGELLSERISEVDSDLNLNYLMILATLLIGVVVRVISFYLFDRGIVRRIHRINSHLDSIRSGSPSTFKPSGKSDAIGELENKMAEWK